MQVTHILVVALQSTKVQNLLGKEKVIVKQWSLLTRGCSGNEAGVNGHIRGRQLISEFPFHSAAIAFCHCRRFSQQKIQHYDMAWYKYIDDTYQGKLTNWRPRRSKSQSIEDSVRLRAASEAVTEERTGLLP